MAVIRRLRRRRAPLRAWRRRPAAAAATRRRGRAIPPSATATAVGRPCPLRRVPRAARSDPPAAGAGMCRRDRRLRWGIICAHRLTAQRAPRAAILTTTARAAAIVTIAIRRRRWVTITAPIRRLNRRPVRQRVRRRPNARAAAPRRHGRLRRWGTAR